MKSYIFKTLEKLGQTSVKSRKIFSSKTRDKENITVWKDSQSGVIYIDDFYTGDKTYIEGEYRKNEDSLSTLSSFYHLESYEDVQRRFKSFLRFFIGKKLLEFGCGNGQFLKAVKPYCKKITGIELQKNYLDTLNSEGIDCFNELSSINDNSIEVLVLFHVLEHLPDPLTTLAILKKKMVSGGTFIFEVPHANDFLLSVAKNEHFKEFTLWSQHLILHTRDSLTRMLKHVGLKKIKIDYVQRYPLSNHLNWLANGKPGGHTSDFSIIDNDNLNETYSFSLSKIGATDTLVAIAEVP